MTKMYSVKMNSVKKYFGQILTAYGELVEMNGRTYRF